MSPPSDYYLSDVSYREEKKEVLVTLSNGAQKIVQRYSFHPSVFIDSKRIPLALLQETVASFDKKRFSITALPNGMVRVQARSFSDLKSIVPFLQNASHWGPSLIEPERQFLIEKNWRYLDAFHFDSNGLEKQSISFDVPNAKLAWNAEPLMETLQSMQRSASSSLGDFLESAAYSQWLRVPLPFVPETNFQRAELFLENLFFQQQLDAPKESGEHFPRRLNPPQGIFDSVAEIDCSPVLLHELIQKNVGWDSMNCACCKPAYWNDSNVSTASMVFVEVLSDGLFFESDNDWFSRSFTDQRPQLLDSRKKIQREWCLKQLPIGPLHRGDRLLLPLSDAKRLVLQEKAEFSTDLENQLVWFCSKKNSFFTQSIQLLQAELQSVSVKHQSIEQNAVASNGLFSTQLLEKNLQSNWLNARLTALQQLLRQLSSHASNPKSRYFTESLARSIESIQSNWLRSFERETIALGGRLLHVSPSKAFMESDNALHVLNMLSANQPLDSTPPRIERLFSRYSFYSSSH